MSNIHRILLALAKDMSRIQILTQLPSKSNVPKRTSNKSKLKQSKPKPNVKYKSSKPKASQVKVQFRNKSNLR